MLKPLELPRLELSKLNISDTRFYEYGKHRIPSVTTILGKTMPKEQKAFLAEWSKKQVDPSSASRRGTKVHSLLEYYLTYRIDPVIDDKELLSYYNTAKPLLDDLEPWLIESQVVHPKYRYAGTVDYLGTYQGQLVIADWKTSAKPKRNLYDNPLQLAAYVKAVNYIYAEFDVHIDAAMLFVVTPTVTQVVKFNETELNYFWHIFLQRLHAFHQLDPSYKPTEESNEQTH